MIKMVLQVLFVLMFNAAPLLAASTGAEPTPTLPPGVTAISQASSVLATATTAPDLGNPADIRTYPVCAVSLQRCLLAASFPG